MTKLSVLNWQSRRATEPVAAAIAAYRQRNPGVEITQVIRPLSDFEHQGIQDVAKRHDIVIFDHPFCGAIAESECFVALDEHLARAPSSNSHVFIGPSLETYRFKGRLWGLPIDGATQHALVRKDLIAYHGAGTPKSHSDVLELGKKVKAKGHFLGTAVATPHGLMSIMSYMANLGSPMQADDEKLLAIPRDSFAKAFDAVREILDLAPPEAMGWNSIDLHEQMVTRDDIVYAPAVYGYATYGETDYVRRLSFAPFPGMVAPFHSGTVIGGTAMGVSRYSQEQNAALAFALFMASDEIQHDLVAHHHGQPAGLRGWQETGMDLLYNGFFSAVASTMEAAWVRPRYEGYVEFQRKGGEIIADGLQNGMAAEAVRQRLTEAGKLAP